MPSIEDQRALERLECLEPPDIDEVLPYEDWWYTLEDALYEEAREDEIINGHARGTC